MQGFLATPPVKTISPAVATRPTMAATRRTTLLCRPRAISRRSRPLAMSEVTSDSAKTVHMLEMAISLSACSASSPNSSMA